MPDSFALLQPAWLGLALVALTVLASARRPRRVSALAQVLEGAVAADVEPPRPPQSYIISILRHTAAPAAAVALAFWLLHEDTPAALLILTAATLAAAGWAAATMLRQMASRVSAPKLVTMVVLRVVAWAMALLILTQPSCRLISTHWELPLLIGLLDDSRSMKLVDDRPDRSRAERVNALLNDAGKALAALRERFDVRLLRIGASAQPSEEWHITGEEPLSAIAGALQEAERLAAQATEAGATVLLIGDGAENVLDAEAVREAARALGARRVPLVAVGAGPPPERTPGVELERLALPTRVGVRERLRVPVVAQVRGSKANDITLEMLWGDAPAERAQVHVLSDDARVAHEFETAASTAGVQRVTARLTLPPALGGAAFETSTFVEVADQRIRVLWLDGPPREEAAFAVRALRRDARLDVSYRPLFGGGDADDAASIPTKWQDVDVVVLGAAPPGALRRDALEALATAVMRDGVGLLLAGGERLLIDGAQRLAPLADVCPVALAFDANAAAARSVSRAGRHFLLTDAGLAHPILAGEDGQPATAAEWTELSALDGTVEVSSTGRLATTLATDQHLHPLLVVQTAGRGRCGVAAWERTWPWVLASERGGELHQRLWRRLILWLANRRPRPWVLTDQPRYTTAALRSGQQRVRIRAGLAGLSRFAGSVDPRDMNATLTVRAIPMAATRPATGSAPATAVVVGMRGAVPVSAPLAFADGEWTADLPSGAAELTLAGTYELEFTATPRESTASGPASRPTVAADEEALVARARFDVLEIDLEQQHPTANLALLRQAAELTAACGGHYVPLEELPAALRALATTDRRRQIETATRYDVVGRHAWLLLSVLAGALSVEWLMRKQARLP